MINGVHHRSRSRTGPPDIQARRAWAEMVQREANLAWAAQNGISLSIDSEALEQHDENLEHQGENLEHGGENLE
jgi:hypothetical protein